MKGELFYTLAKRARWRWRKEMEMTALAPAVVVAVLHREKHWSFMRLQKKKKASRKLTRNLLLSEPLQICLSCFNKSRISYSHLVHYYKFHIAVHCLMPLAVSRQFRHRNQTSLVSDTRVPMVWGSCQAVAFKRATFAWHHTRNQPTPACHSNLAIWFCDFCRASGLAPLSCLASHSATATAAAGWQLLWQSADVSSARAVNPPSEFPKRIYKKRVWLKDAKSLS